MLDFQLTLKIILKNRFQRSWVISFHLFQCWRYRANMPKWLVSGVQKEEIKQIEVVSGETDTDTTATKSHWQIIKKLLASDYIYYTYICKTTQIWNYFFYPWYVIYPSLCTKWQENSLRNIFLETYEWWDARNKPVNSHLLDINWEEILF